MSLNRPYRYFTFVGLCSISVAKSAAKRLCEGSCSHCSRLHNSLLRVSHSFSNNKRIDPGDVTDRKTLRHSLECKSFRWYDSGHTCCRQCVTRYTWGCERVAVLPAHITIYALFFPGTLTTSTRICLCPSTKTCWARD